MCWWRPKSKNISNDLGLYFSLEHRYRTLVPTDSQKYTDISDKNLWAVVCKHLGGKPWFFQNDNAPVHRSLQARQWINEQGETFKRIS